MACEWDVDRSCLPELPAEDDTDYDEMVRRQNNAVDIAVAVMWALSGRQFGICETTVRPCRSRSQPYWIGHPYDQTVAPWSPNFNSGRWENVACGCSGPICYVAGPAVVHLPGPAVEIVTVTIEGLVLDEEEYVLERDALYRVGGNWPSQDLSQPLGQPGTWSVIYDKGIAVPAGVDTLTGQLALEMLKACSGDKCRLPRTVISTTRSGVTHGFDPSRMLSMGFTGLSEIDSWLVAVNPNKLSAGPRVL